MIDENEQLKAKLNDRYKFQNVIGKSKKMQELFELIESVAASEANILIQGENGTGKELIANAIHYNSKRSKGPLLEHLFGCRVGREFFEQNQQDSSGWHCEDGANHAESDFCPGSHFSPPGVDLNPLLVVEGIALPTRSRLPRLHIRTVP